MMTVRNLRFPVLIGGGVVAAGVLFYFANAHINSQATQGTIAHRDVYRDSDVKPGDIGTPGTAPVAVKAVLESKDFQKLAKNQVFQGLMSNKAFHELATNGMFYALIKNQAFTNMVQNSEFRQAMQNQALVSNLRESQAHGMTAALKDQLFAAHAQDLATNSSFNALVNNSSFIGLLHQSTFVNLLASNQFGLLMKNAAFLSLASSSEFQNAMMTGNAASLNNQLLMLNSNLSSQMARQ